MLSEKQFKVLEILINHEEDLTQRFIAQETGMSTGNTNKIIKELTELNYVKDGRITQIGVEAMSPYRVKRAVFIVAGFGSRMVPITLNTPKPLVRINGKRIIDSMLDAVVDAGINEIYLVRGYLSEQFDQLLYKYPQIKFIENPIYNESNNISSILCASNLLRNAYVLEGDLLLYKKKLIKKYQYSSNYLGVPVEKTDDWCFKTNSKGIITKLCVGGKDCYHMYGISYWDENDGAKLVGHIKDVFHSPGGKERYWDQVALEYNIQSYEIHVRECTFDDIIEIDTFNELKKIDKTYDV